jgi:hypothetical protein
MSRKEPSFGQLIRYMSDIDKTDEQYNLYQNLYSRTIDELEQEFQTNAKMMFKRQNGVYLYHEILSITKTKNLADEQQKEILRVIAHEYAEQRAKHNLIFATLHDDHDDHLHYHFIISANALGERKKTRMSKYDFDKFKKNMEKWTLEKYPELEQKIAINKQAGEKLSNKTAEKKRRTGNTPELDLLKEKLRYVFAHTSGFMEKNGFTVFVIDPENPDRSNCLNPLAEAENPIEMEQVAEILMHASSANSGGKDDFWRQGATRFVSLFIKCLKNAGEENPAYYNLHNLYYLFQNFGEDGANPDNFMSRYTIDPSNPADETLWNEYKGVLTGNGAKFCSKCHHGFKSFIKSEYCQNHQ